MAPGLSDHLVAQGLLQRGPEARLISAPLDAYFERSVSKSQENLFKIVVISSKVTLAVPRLVCKNAVLCAAAGRDPGGLHCAGEPRTRGLRKRQDREEQQLLQIREFLSFSFPFFTASELWSFSIHLEETNSRFLFLWIFQRRKFRHDSLLC